MSWLSRQVVIAREDASGRLIVEQAPTVADFQHDVAEAHDGLVQLVGNIITIRGHGRTVCYKLRPVSQYDWMNGIMVGDKVYDDAEVNA